MAGHDPFYAPREWSEQGCSAGWVLAGAGMVVGRFGPVVRVCGRGGARVEMVVGCCRAGCAGGRMLQAMVQAPLMRVRPCRRMRVRRFSAAQRVCSQASLAAVPM